MIMPIDLHLTGKVRISLPGTMTVLQVVHVHNVFDNVAMYVIILNNK